MRTPKRIARVAILTMWCLALPAAAYAVNVSSSDGSGTQSRTTTYNNGAVVSGNLKSTAEYPVYYQGRVDWPQWYCSDSTVGRYSTDTTSTSAVTRGGIIAATPGAGCSSAGVLSKVCRNKPNLTPDSCGSWSTKY